MTVHNDVLEIADNPAHGYLDKEARYFVGARADMIERLPVDPSAAILEIGCGSGETGAMALARRRAARYVGVELMSEPAAAAAERLSDVIVGDVERLDLPFQAAEFDALILSEVLEHLREPEGVLNRLGRFVRPGGSVLASSPNIAHWKVIRELVQGRFPQDKSGVFDRTHLRWFTPASFADMFERSGFHVLAVGPVRRFSAKQRLAAKFLGRRFEHLLMTQIFLEARRR